MAIDSRQIILGNGAILLSFWEYFETEERWDDCQVWITTGSEWVPLRTMTWGSSDGWRMSALDLSAYAGQIVRLRFRFDTQDRVANDYPGWFVDDIRVYSSSLDSDVDGLVDDLELFVYSTDPLDVDTDNDGLLDGNEVIIYTTDPLDSDTDGDGLSDLEEVSGVTYGFLTDPLNPDSDEDAASDGVEVDLGRNPSDASDGGGTSMVFGRITTSGFGLVDAEIQMTGKSGFLYHWDLTDGSGAFGIAGVIPGEYYVRVGADGCADEWYINADHRSAAAPLQVQPNSIVIGLDFELTHGRNPALVEITSNPTGAVVYLDYIPSALVTPVILDIGEPASQCHVPDPRCMRHASHSVRPGAHTIWVQKAGRPWPSPKQVDAREAETVSVHFDLTSDEVGAMSVTTVPSGAAVYVDHADVALGQTPIVVDNLSPGFHTLLVKKDDALMPQPIRAMISADATNAVSLPLGAIDSPAADLFVRSIPPGAAIYVDYLPVTNVTDSLVRLLDPVSHSGRGWHSVSHSILLRKDGFIPAAPRTIAALKNEEQVLTVLLLSDETSPSDLDSDGLPDQWEDSYDLNNSDPTMSGAEDDADGDGATNLEEMIAGTDPTDSDSLFITDELILSPHSSTGPVLLVPTIPGKKYLIQSSSDLETGWSNITGVFTATDYSTEIPLHDTATARQKYYRSLVLGGP